MNSMTALAHRRAILCGRYCPRSPDRNFVAPYTYLSPVGTAAIYSPLIGALYCYPGKP
jgi:hypothetical protein